MTIRTVEGRDQETICALSTPPGYGGISVVRLSGDAALKIVRSLARFIPENAESHKVYYGHIRSLDQSKILDEVLVTYFQQGRSFTGEPVVEISAHGSPVVVRSLMEELVGAGCRVADRGEFTYRAFMNGRLDLVQAESILSLIESKSEISARNSLRQLGGSLSKKLEDIEDDLIWCLAHIEASIDFSTEGLEVVTNDQLNERFTRVEKELRQLTNSYQSGRLLKDGLQLVLLGEPNVGKSSLLNLLAQEDRAIVTNIAGTTRDTIEAGFVMNGVRVNVTDTAGLRETTDQVESLGIARSLKASESADLVFYVFDCAVGLLPTDLLRVDQTSSSKLMLIGNKSDLLSTHDQTNLRSKIEGQLRTLKYFQNEANLNEWMQNNVHFVSALDENSRGRLIECLQSVLETTSFDDEAVVSQARHFENLSRALEIMKASKDLLQQNVSPELLAMEMKESLLCLQQTLGKSFDDQIMDRVFKEFCIGK